MKLDQSGRMRSSLMLAVVAAAATWGSSGMVRGADWLGGTGNWTDGTMWNTGSAPATGMALIDNGNPAGSVVTVSSVVGANPGLAVTIDPGDTVQVKDGGLLRAASIQVDGSLTTSGTSAAIGWGQGLLSLTGTGTMTFGAATTTLRVATTVLNVQMLSTGSGLTLSGPFDASVNIGRGQWITNSAHIMVDGTGKWVTLGGSGLGTTSQNFGAIDATNGANLNLSLIQNAAGGTVSISGGGTMQWWPLASPKASNLGTINVDHSTLALHSGLFGGMSVLDGTINLTEATVTAEEGFTVTADGVLSGAATVVVPDALWHYPSSIAGTIRPGGAGGTGTMTFARRTPSSAMNVGFVAGGHYACDLGTAGTADLLVVDGTLDLSTNSDFLDLSHVNSTMPNVPYLVATYGALTGTFNNVTPGYVVDYSVPGSIYVTLLPEPTAAVGLGAVAVAGMMRRRRARR